MTQLTKKLLLNILFFVLIALVCWLFYRSCSNKSNKRILPAKMEEIKQTVKLSSLEIITEEIYKDTINNKIAVSRTRSKTRINFDIENLEMLEQGDTTVIFLPPEIIEIFESSNDGYQLLDVWHVQHPDDPINITLTNAEENEYKRRAKKYITQQMYDKGYVTRARQNAMNSLVKLFSGFKDNILIIDPFPDGWQEQTPELFSPEEFLRRKD